MHVYYVCTLKECVHNVNINIRNLPQHILLILVCVIITAIRNRYLHSLQESIL